VRCPPPWESGSCERRRSRSQPSGADISKDTPERCRPGSSRSCCPAADEMLMLMPFTSSLVSAAGRRAPAGGELIHPERTAIPVRQRRPGAIHQLNAGNQRRDLHRPSSRWAAHRRRPGSSRPVALTFCTSPIGASPETVTDSSRAPDAQFGIDRRSETGVTRCLHVSPCQSLSPRS